MNAQTYPKLEQFLGGYFHQDWTDEAQTSAAVIEGYRKKVAPAALGALTAEIQKLREEGLKEPALKKRLSELGSFFEPSSENLTATRWLADLEQALNLPRSSKSG